MNKDCHNKFSTVNGIGSIRIRLCAEMFFCPKLEHGKGTETSLVPFSFIRTRYCARLENVMSCNNVLFFSS